jgi:uncharacterized protein
MAKYQKEGKYEILDSNMPSVHQVAVIKVIPEDMRGKYKIGQQWPIPYRLRMAKNIIEREGLENARAIIRTMGIDIKLDNNGPYVKEEPLM